MNLTRGVVFTSRADYGVRRGLAAIREAVPDCRWLVVCATPRRSLSGIIASQRRNLRRHGWRWIPYQAGEAMRMLHARLRGPRRLPDQQPGASFELDALRRLDGVEWIDVDDLHSAATLARVREFAPQLGLSLAAPILRAELFEIPTLGTLNLHKGKVPDFRGMPAAFWELFTGAREVGCTVHRVSAALDAGDVLLADTIPVRAFSSVRGLQILLDEMGIDLVARAVRRIADASASFAPQQPGGHTYRRPTLAQEAALRRRQAAQHASRGASERIKDALFWIYCRCLAPLPRWLRGLTNMQRVVVLLYHRVNDDMRDDLTVGIEQFERQMSWIAEHCQVVSLDAVSAGTFSRRSPRPIVAVTFDDGYLDNYEIAARVLLRLRLPATFFVSTGRIGNDSGFDHDLRRKGEKLPTMSWDHLRTMRRWGFDVGSHTVTHLDCGRAPLADIRAELDESREHLRENLALARVAFAYPFGGREHITEEARDQARKAGYSACLSAFGGYNDGDIDPFRIRRISISHRFSLLGFRARLEGMWR